MYPEGMKKSNAIVHDYCKQLPHMHHLEILEKEKSINNRKAGRLRDGTYHQNFQRCHDCEKVSFSFSWYLASRGWRGGVVAIELPRGKRGAYR